MLASTVFSGPPAYLLQPATATAIFYALIYAIWTAQWFCAVTSLLRTTHARQALFPADYSLRSYFCRPRLFVTAISNATPLLHGLVTVLLIAKAVAGNLVAVSVWLHRQECCRRRALGDLRGRDTRQRPVHFGRRPHLHGPGHGLHGLGHCKRNHHRRAAASPHESLRHGVHHSGRGHVPRAILCVMGADSRARRAQGVL
ncbi:hypothetical protein AMAG_12704 [Allomyces macrogynus ATCC 38327]|uniref:Uncharacterized protein n=1 Tax=Allomyces macrogynus (strain ATCC 38327) TaxID=578462 RepID=A0A0L0T1N5_ALLM3|nr:hypothetical protein AMAG_12704 [Allomyces macrogynus ATCC 38327]|eukprot:KNE68535.1 hypothetical protein AMAG_12704 [Allomyces macrogynus ATCC 38327]